jgi:phosphomannomutase
MGERSLGFPVSMMAARKKVFGAYDVRGLLDKEIDEAFAFDLGRAYGGFLCPGTTGLFLLGHDARPASPLLAKSFADGLARSGHDVALAGLASTPLINWYGSRPEFDGSVTVTASHLSGDYTGFKLSGREALPLSSEFGLKEIADGMESLAVGRIPERSPGDITSIHILDSYVDHLKNYLRPEKSLRIALDAGNGAAGPELAGLFASCKAVEIVGLGMAADGDYSDRSSNPLEKGALARLAAAVQERRCDFGVAFDGDADRSIFVDENGQMVPTDVILALIASRLLAASPGATVLYDLRCSRSVPETISAAGGRALRTRVGNTFIRADMQKHRAIFAGELSGHYYYGDLSSSDNAVRTLIELVNLVSTSEKRLSRLTAEYTPYPTSGEINIEVNNIKELLVRLEDNFSGGEVDHLDGLSVAYGDWWFNARPSATEKVLRITAGAIRPQILDQQVKRLLNQIQSC